MCLRYPGIKLFVGRNELKRLMMSVFVTWREVCKDFKIPENIWKLNSKYNYIEFINFKTKKFDGDGSRIDLLDVAYQPRDPLYERFGSTEYTSGWLEEVGEIHEKAFDVLKSRIGRYLNKKYNIFPKMLLTCNPKKNWVYTQVYKEWKKNKLEDGITFIQKDSLGNDIFWAFIQALYKDNPYTADIYSEQLAAIKDPVLRTRLKDGNWEYEDDDSKLMDYEAILDIFENEYVNYEPLTKEDYEDIDEDDYNEIKKTWDIDNKMKKRETEMYLTVDVARYGRDKCVFTLWDGLFIKKIWTLDKNDLQPTEGLKKGLTIVKEKIRKIRQQFYVPASHVLIDDDGVGGGVVDDVYNYKGFVNNSSPIKEFNADEQCTKKYNYKNLKAQCWYTLAEYINNHKIGCYKDIPEDIKMKLIEDLEVMRRKDIEKDEMSLAVITKEEIKDILGRSPDIGDTLMMRMYFELGTVDFDYGVA